MAHVTVVDVFGNLTTDLPVAALAGRRDVVIRLYGKQVDGIVILWLPAGELVAIVDSELCGDCIAMAARPNYWVPALAQLSM
jgi:hypothetical protein